MFTNYLRIAFRNLLKDKRFSLVTLLGLAIGMAASCMLFLHTGFELSYDRFYPHADRMYRVYLDIYQKGNLDVQSARVSPVVATAFQQEFSGVEATTRLVILGKDGILTHQDRYVGEPNVYLADTAFFDMFSVTLLRGNAAQALRAPFCAVITATTAQALFGEEDPIGKSITVDAENFDGNSPSFQVTGIMQDLPENTHLPSGVLLSYTTLHAFVGHQFDNSWQWNNTYTYVRLHPQADPQSLEAAFADIVHRSMGRQPAKREMDWQYRLQPVTDIHLYSDLQHEAAANGNALYVNLLLAAGGLILLIAYTNFVNLTTVRALSRAKEVGIRKVSGALQRQLLAQFFLEVFMMNAIAIAVALLILYWAIPFASSAFGLSFTLAMQPSWLWLGVLLWCGILVVGSGWYPAFLLSRYKPSRVLKGYVGGSRTGAAFRKVLVTGQFVVAIVLVTLTLAVGRQLHFMQQQNLGFDPKQLLVVKAPKAVDDAGENNFQRFQRSVGQLSQVISVSGSSTIPGEEIYWYEDQVTVNGLETQGVFSRMSVAPNYFSQLGIALLSGQAFGGFARDQWIINQTALHLLGFDKPDQAIGQLLTQGHQTGEIIGVVQDFHQQSLKTALDPILFFCGEGTLYYTMKLGAGEIGSTLKAIKGRYEQLFPGSPFHYFFLDEFYNRQYIAEQRFNQLIKLFSGLAILIACLGLFALSSYSVAQRTKEIGIRKAMGASIHSLLLLLLRQYVQWIGAALLIAIPLANYVATEWLQNFAFRTNVGGGFLLFPGILVMLAAVLSVSGQTISAARQNPVKSLRDE